MITTRELLHAIHGMCDPEEEFLILHTSIPQLVRSAHAAMKGVFLSTVRSLLREGKSVMMPAFTFSFTRGVPFHVDRTPSETGQLSNWIKDLPEFRRTPNPIFSFLVAGPLAERVMECDHTDAYGPKSPFAAMESLGGRIIMLGAEWDYCSFLHCMEQEFAVPYREWKRFEGTVDYGLGPIREETRVFVRRSDIATTLNFRIIRRTAWTAGLIRTANLGEGRIESVAVCDLAAHCRNQLASDPYVLLQNPRLVEKVVNDRSAQLANPEFRVALLSEGNIALIAKEVQTTLDQLVPNRRAAIYSNEVGRMYADINDPSSPLYAFKPDCTVFLSRAEDLVGAAHLEYVEPATVKAAFRRYENGICRYKATSGNQIVVATFASPGPSWQGTGGNRAPDSVRALVNEANASLQKLMSGEHAIILDVTSIAAAEGSQLTDPRMWYIARMPYSAEATSALAARIVGVIASLMGQSIRILVTDLDNTLWGGVLGEDGVSGIRLGGDFPGNVYSDFQRGLKRLKERGIILAICSKNEEVSVIEAMTHHREMVLRPDDFAILKINWHAKSRNILEIASALGISPAHIMFIDDSPAECEEVRRAVPDVHVLHLPSDPTRYAQALLSFPLLDVAYLTDADRGRSQAYTVRATIKEASKRYKNVEDFWASLNVRVTFCPLADDNVARAAQLMAKTNQLNTSIRRYGAADLFKIDSTWGRVWVLRVADHYSREETLGALVLDQRPLSSGVLQVDSLVMSCRALGRGVEHGVVAFVLSSAARAGLEEVRVEYASTDRNRIVRMLLSECGFTEADASWRQDLADAEQSRPRWLLIETPDEFDGCLMRPARGDKNV